jgi:hypothetical protein
MPGFCNTNYFFAIMKDQLNYAPFPLTCLKKRQVLHLYQAFSTQQSAYTFIIVEDKLRFD